VTGPRPTLSGSAEPGSTVTLTLDGAVAGTVTADPAGTWLFTPASDLADGEHTVFATATGAGGTSLASPPVSFIVDTADEPAVPKDSGCSAGPGDASWMLPGMLLLAGLAARRRREPGARALHSGHP
jgi:MYXO-CTERM domain-containing protein